ncbi:MAG: DUF3604 domain-containing protein [Pseudomonadales bacterium]
MTILLVVCVACSPVEDPTLFPRFDSSEIGVLPDKPIQTPQTDRQLLWGDLHIHTSLSTDAYTMGVRALPDDAYRFARGGVIEHGLGYPIQISRPLDFAAVTDHSEYLGAVRSANPDLPLSRKSLRERLLNDGPLSVTIAFLQTTMGFSLKNVAELASESVSTAAWQQIIEAAEANNIPGSFTTFIAYEWSSMPDSRNLHRNVIFKSSLVPVLPFSAIDSEDPRELWATLNAQRAQGIASMAIPHNGNVSGGLMYKDTQFDGTAISAEYAEERMHNESVSEIFQVKGSSETHPALSPADDFAGFELVDELLSAKVVYSEPVGSYVRDALRRGIEFSHNEGFNPYQFGVIGSSDSHNASSPVDENNFHGKLPLMDGSAGLRLGISTLLPDSANRARKWSAAGLAAVWAKENTRAEIFDAMQRRETYATSGPRMTVRLFAAWDYPADLLAQPNRVGMADALGVPMGGELGKAESDAPVLAVWAAKDPAGANLDRIQIIKAWVDAEGVSHENIFDVVCSDERLPDPESGLVSTVGSTVNVIDASYDNSIGAPQLATLWRDPGFDPLRPAFYYARVIEIPTPRWSTFDAVKLGVVAPEPSSIQERAVTSAIWYQPSLQL